MERHFVIGRAPAFIFVGFAILLLFMDVGLLNENLQLRRSQHQNDGPGPMSEGQTLPAVRGANVDGAFVTVGYDKTSANTVLLLFSPGCEPCEAAAKGWEEMVAKNHGRYRFVAVSTIPDARAVREFMLNHRLSDAVVIAKVDPADREKYGLGFVPQTILVDTSGVIEKVWPGAIPAGRLKEIEGYLGL